MTHCLIDILQFGILYYFVSSSESSFCILFMFLLKKSYASLMKFKFKLLESTLYLYFCIVDNNINPALFCIVFLF